MLKYAIINTTQGIEVFFKPVAGEQNHVIAVKLLILSSDKSELANCNSYFSYNNSECKRSAVCSANLSGEDLWLKKYRHLIQIKSANIQIKIFIVVFFNSWLDNNTEQKVN